jgi:diguanylate cyclase (GGDEF)-like protein/PAS domain S-box-containing protein
LFRNTFLGALFGLVISELVLLSILWKPTTELQKVVDALPKLAENDFDAARHSFKASVSDKLVTDESDVLKSTALSLSYQLEALHSLLNNRASQLESRGLELETERNFVLGLLNTAHALILTQNSRGEVLMINQHGKKLLGLEADVAEGTNFASLLHGRDEIQLIVQQLQELQQGLVEDVHHESPMMNEHGQPRFMSWFHSRLPERGEEGHDILTVAIDISERRQAEDNLGWLASHDPLTGLVNRRRFEDELEQVMAASRRYGHAGAVFFLDLDQFKDVNDSSGHQIGDEMLKRVADALVGSASNADIVSRLGGDEFAVLVHECDEMQAGELAEKFCRSLIKIAVPGVKRIHRISCSIGVALFPRHGEGQSEILSNADIAMYQAKDAGRNTWSIFNEDEFGKERIQERVYWNDRVKNILNGETFEVFFQPIVRISDGFSSHYEALLRIYNEEQQLVGPQQFIEAAERGGLMPQVDEKVITKVLSALKELNQQGVNARVSINLSGLSFRNENLLEHIASGLKKFSVDPHSVIFEITETAAVSDIDVAVGLMSKIRKMGCQFALDDFGVGFSSLHYLKQLPVDYLKIDGSFIQAIHKRRDDRILVKALVDIASEFGQFTVAEFVDTPEALAVLKDLRVDYAQGYYVGKPMPLSALLES